jgi:hypothetical protein
MNEKRMHNERETENGKKKKKKNENAYSIAGIIYGDRVCRVCLGEAIVKQGLSQSTPDVNHRLSHVAFALMLPVI